MDLAPEQLDGLEVHLVPLIITLDGKSYRSGVDLHPDEFYRLLMASKGFPTTSQPSAGEFAEVYRRLAATDPEILSIHISSGLSGTLNSAKAGAALVPEAKVTFVDTKTLSGAQGWQVQAAALAIKAGWPLDRTLAAVEKVGEATDSLFTVATLRYLIHGGRISHIKGLLASVLDIKPVISVEKTGIYGQRAQARTLKSAIQRIAALVREKHRPGTALRLQVVHAENPEGATMLQELIDPHFECAWLPTTSIAPVLGAHTGPGLVGLAFGPRSAYEGILP